MALTTPTWGPWGTDLHDIGRVIDPNRGAWWEVAAVIERMRGKTIVHDVHTESGVHLQAATPDLSAWRWRYQLQWRDVECVDVDVVAPLSASSSDRATNRDSINARAARGVS